MANKHKGEVLLQIDGTDYIMRLGMNELCEIETVTGVKMADLNDELASASASMVRAVVWAGLCGGGHDITLSDAGNLIDAFGLSNISEKLSDAFLVAFPAEEETDNPTKAGKNGTGKSS